MAYIDDYVSSIEPLLYMYSPLADDLVHLTLSYVRRLCEEQYKRGDLETIPKNEVHTCMLDLRVTIDSFVSSVTFVYEGEVNVRCTDTDTYTFKFMMAGTKYTLTGGKLFGETMTFEAGQSSKIAGFLVHKVTLLPHRFEL